jgi:hypothetical protein
MILPASVTALLILISLLTNGASFQSENSAMLIL